MSKRAQTTLNILVVEDNPNILRILNELLAADGHTVRIASDGETGMELLESEEFDLIITDLGLPGMSGWELALASKRYQANTAVIAISSWQGKNAEEKMPDSGIDTVIWKPFRFDQVKESIENLCFSTSQDGRDK